MRPSILACRNESTTTRSRTPTKVIRDHFTQATETNNKGRSSPCWQKPTCRPGYGLPSCWLGPHKRDKHVLPEPLPSPCYWFPAIIRYVSPATGLQLAPTSAVIRDHPPASPTAGLGFIIIIPFSPKGWPRFPLTDWHGFSEHLATIHNNKPA